MKNVRPEGSTVLYVQRLATAFFLQSAEASREFDRCFPGQRDRCSALLMWAEEEVEWFAERLDKQVFNMIIIIFLTIITIIILDKQVFNSQSAISVVAACVAFLRRQAERLLSQGLDLLFMLDARLQASVEKVKLSDSSSNQVILYVCQVVMEARDKAVEAVKLRWAEERWQEHECGSR